MFFSSKTNGFYSSESPKIPDDAVELLNDAYSALLNGQSNGMSISSDKDGYPILVDQPPPTSEQRLSSAEALRDKYLSLAALRIAPLQYAADLDDASADDLALLKKWKKYSVAVNRLDLSQEPLVWPDQPLAE